MNGRADGDREFVHARHALFWVDEQPLPVERHHLHLELGPLGRQAAVWIEIVAAHPRDDSEEQDGEQRDDPDDELDPIVIVPVRTPFGAGVTRAEPPGEGEREHDDGNDDRQHLGERFEHQLTFGGADGADRGEHALGAASKR